MYSGNNPIIQEKYDGVTLIETRFNIISGGQVLGHIRKLYGTSEDYEFFYLDNLSSRRVVLDNAGTVLDKFTYTAYGELTHVSGSNSYLASFTGKEYDATGFIYFNARYYDPVVGRFLTEDSVRDGLNYYNYCKNNPINFTDPDGHRFDDDLGIDLERKRRNKPKQPGLSRNPYDTQISDDVDTKPRDPGKDLRDLKDAEKGLDQDPMGLTPEEVGEEDTLVDPTKGLEVVAGAEIISLGSTLAVSGGYAVTGAAVPGIAGSGTLAATGVTTGGIIGGAGLIVVGLSIVAIGIDFIEGDGLDKTQKVINWALGN